MTEAQAIPSRAMAPVAEPQEIHYGRTGKPHSARYKWGVLGIGIGAQAAFSAAFQGIPTAGSFLALAYHLNTGQLGVVLAAVTFGIFASDVFWGILSDRVGERRVLITGMSGTTLALGAVTLFLTPHGNSAPSYLLLAVVLLLAGAMGGCVN